MFASSIEGTILSELSGNCLIPADKKPEDVAEFGADTPVKRPAQPEEIAPAFVYFASEIDSSYVTGEVLTLLGGETTAG